MGRSATGEKNQLSNFVENVTFTDTTMLIETTVNLYWPNRLDNSRQI